ncbi:hypothetical protein FGADI_4549 [Fusarium gaditjirri]|uniref:Uncharacterized protein n=1 Tax=Fusarium gaditjirri TaxID=282569 RepID=A0A8H4TCV9_9HYPO|nr:hypothetical protein FGADI_4549 [Fusarium gaditjirri]
MSRHTKLQQIVDQLHVGDALNLKNSFPNDPMLEKCYAIRVSPTKYLSKTFKYPVTLLAAMFDTGCVISGSRALDYFIPGSATVESDWDFYVPGYKESVADMIYALSKCGVVWNLEGDAITAAISQHGCVTIKRVVLESLCSWISGLEPPEASELMGQALYTIVSEFERIRGNEWPAMYVATHHSDGKISLEPNEEDKSQCDEHTPPYLDATGKPFSMLRGTIQTKAGIQPVQLIVGCHYSGIKSCLSFIKDFYASHVQCFISGWCASHMYYHHASSKNPVRWESSFFLSSARIPIEKAIQKYRSRGYEFRRADAMEPTARRLDDDKAFFIDFSDIYRPFLRRSNLDLLDVWVIDRRKNLKGVQWVEFDRNIFDMSSYMDKCLRRQDSYAVAAYSLPLVRLRRLADIIAFNDPGSNELRDRSFRSSIRKTISGTRWHITEAARSGTIYCALRDANPWSWVL